MADQGKFIVYKSSAGSGKTFTLVREYLSIALQRPDVFRNILAVTFTNKAANELKDRVVSYLAALSEPGNNQDSVAVRHLLPLLINDTGFNREEIVSRSGILLQRVMHEYSDYSIGTIDSFMHRVIRTFSFDLKRPFDFEVEMDVERLFTQVIGLMISRAGTRDELTRVLVDFIEKKADDEKGWNIEKELLEIAKVLMDEDSQRFLPEILKLDISDFYEIRDRIEGFRNQVRQRLKKLGEKALEVIESRGHDRYVFYQGKRGIAGYFESLAREEWDRIKPNSYAMDTINNGKWFSGSTDASQKESMEEVTRLLTPICDEIRQIVCDDLGRYGIFGLINRNLFPLAVLSEIERELDSFKKENKIVAIAEFNRLIHDVVKDQPVPFIYERAGERYHHYLLDEFQDTSVMQWHNILPLVENGLGDNNKSLVVGDGKQAIYRWRAGDVEQFEALPELLGSGDDPLLTMRQQVLKRNYDQRQLKENFRSSPVIIGFNNDFFTMARQYIPEDFRDVYDDVVQQSSAAEGDGLVSIELVDDKAHEDYFDEVLQRTRRILQELLEDGYGLNDVAILFRDNARASMMAARLLQDGINVVSAESLLLKFSDKVNFIISWMRFLVDPGDRVSLATIVHYLLENGWMDPDEARQILEPGAAEPDGLALAAILEGIIAKRDADFCLRKLKTLTTFGLTEALVQAFYLNKPTDPYIRFFEDAVLKFIRFQVDLPDEFLSWWEEEKETASVVIPEGIDAVRIMTVHKAKGLEFPVVIYPFAEDSNRLTKKSRWMAFSDPLVPRLETVYLPLGDVMEGTLFEGVLREERAKTFVDKMNVLYVALTRPKERLYIMTRLFNGKVKEPYTYPKMFTAFLRSKDLVVEGEQSYLFGERRPRIRGSEKQGAMQAELAGGESRDWTKKVFLRLRSALLWDTEATEKSVEWGNLVHEVLSGIRYAEDKEHSIACLLDEGIISPSEVESLSLMIGQLLDDPETGRFFSREYEVLNEQEIIDRRGLPHRPDRVLLKDNKAIILDYKTGMPKKIHEDQLRDYAALLKEMKYEVDGAYLLYLGSTFKLVEVAV